ICMDRSPFGNRFSCGAGTMSFVRFVELLPAGIALPLGIASLAVQTSIKRLHAGVHALQAGISFLIKDY
ncbi:hypothetical protein, partial [Paenibacillus sp. NPDC093718]|uniref:hypothetical protein n=1 Tax=Paenibacillus sp. NPDC093718 TaxID=3390601 RepID=UPI003D0330C3